LKALSDLLFKYQRQLDVKSMHLDNGKTRSLVEIIWRLMTSN